MYIYIYIYIYIYLYILVDNPSLSRGGWDVMINNRNYDHNILFGTLCVNIRT